MSDLKSEFKVWRRKFRSIRSLSDLQQFKFSFRRDFSAINAEGWFGSKLVQMGDEEAIKYYRKNNYEFSNETYETATFTDTCGRCKGEGVVGGYTHADNCQIEYGCDGCGGRGYRFYKKVDGWFSSSFEWVNGEDGFKKGSGRTKYEASLSYEDGSFVIGLSPEF